MATRILKALIWLAVAVNLWIFSRVTVDDAFITWRYGRNLVDHGVWNYNPTNFDPTQAYTNPIFAAISIAPALLGVNVVLFFKVIALISTVIFIWYFIARRPEAEVPLALFLAVPATVIHIFAGLETFVFVALVFLLLKALHEDNLKFALIATLFLVVTRPESVLLTVLVPVFLSVKIRAKKLDIKLNRLLISSASIASFCTVFFLVNYLLFGEVLPNTFFVKSGQFYMNGTFMVWLLALLPLVPIALLRLWKEVLFALAFYLPIVFNYSTSLLSMDYANRFGFQVYAPLTLFAIYVLALRSNREALANELFRRKFPRGLALLVSPVLAIGFLIPSFNGQLLGLTRYYTTLQSVQGELGRVAQQLNAEGFVKVTAMGDAGIFAYESGLPNLDPRKLGTHMGALGGVTRKLVEAYEVDFVIISNYETADSILRPYVLRSSLVHVCDAYMSSSYGMEVWAKTDTKRLVDVCTASNKFKDTQLDLSSLTKPPWSEWQ